MNTEIIEGIKADLAELEAMTEEEIMRIHEADSKADAVEAIIGRWYLESGEERYEYFMEDIKKLI